MKMPSRSKRWGGLCALLATLACSGDPRGAESTSSSGGGGGSRQGTSGTGGQVEDASSSGGSDAVRPAAPAEASLDGDGEASFDGSNADVDASCVKTVIDISPSFTDIFIMLDTSDSMKCSAFDDACENVFLPVTPPSRWDSVVDAVNAFIALPGNSGAGVGLGLFPFSLNTLPSCNAPDYAKPVVPIAPLPGNAARIKNAVAMAIPAGGTPTVAALTGAVSYVKAYSMTVPTRRTAIVLVTDGLPTSCGTISAAAMLAMMAYGGSPPITTYVVGLGNTAALDQIALAGSGGTQHYFPATGDVAGKLTAALNDASSAATCEYSKPEKVHDVDLVSMEVTIGTGGIAQHVDRVTNAAACSASGGWYYDDNALPSKATLCPATCDPLKANPGSTARLVVGCPGPSADSISAAR